VLNDLGVAYAKLGRMDEAVAKFREAVRLNPSLRTAQANLAKAWAGAYIDCSVPGTVRGLTKPPKNHPEEIRNYG
jgi:tetratricopeptide (TPR) repeat protein